MNLDNAVTQNLIKNIIMCPELSVNTENQFSKVMLPPICSTILCCKGNVNENALRN